MLPFMARKQGSSAVLENKVDAEGKSQPDMASSDLADAMSDFLAALEAKDADGMALAFEAAYDACGSPAPSIEDGLE